MSDSFKCAICRKTFLKGWTDGEAKREFNNFFGEEFSESETTLVCDDCFQNIHPRKHPDKIKKNYDLPNNTQKTFTSV